MDVKLEGDLRKTDHEDLDIPYLKSLNKQNKTTSGFLHQIQHKNNYKQEYSLKKWKENYGRKTYLLGFKCFSYDAYRNLIDPEYSSFGELDDNGESPIYCSKFGESQSTKSILCLGYESGQICLQKIKKKRRSGDLIVKSAHANAIYDLTWISNENSLLSASADFDVKLWQLTTEDLIKAQTFKGHVKSVKSVSSNPWDRNVFASGDTDGRIILWDTRCSNSKKANEISMSHTYHRSYSRQPVLNSITGLLFNEEHNIISAGSSDGVVKIWDLRRTYSIGKRLPQSLWDLGLTNDSTFTGFTCMSLSPFKERLYVSCLNGNIYCYHITKPTIYPIAAYFGFSKYNFHCKSCLSPCGSYLLSGSGSAAAYIWSTNSPGCPIASLSGHEDIVTTVAWSEDDTLVTCDDAKYRIFKCNNNSETNLKEKYDEYIKGYAESMKEKCVLKESLSLKTDIESTECVTHGLELTKSTCEELKNKFDTRDSPDSLPQTCFTPSHSKFRSKVEKTPKTGEKRTLLSWLSSSKKTPSSDSDSLIITTPKSAKTPGKNITSKRRLSVLMENNQENINGENKRLALSPTKNILCERENHKNYSSTTAKMLIYDDDFKEIKIPESTSSNDKDDVDDFELINDPSHSKGSTKFSSLRMDTATEEQKFYSNTGATTPVRHSSSIIPSTPSHLSPVNACLLTSPTANLPNYIVDGRSPHDRGESPKIQKREVDWLTTLRREKNSFAKGMEHLTKDEKTKSKVTPKCKKKRNL